MQALRIEQDGDLLRVTMARPERRNAFDAELIAGLTEAFGAVGDDVRAVLLAGEGEWLELRHVAQDRSAFASGVLAAARFVARTAPGLYTLEDLLSAPGR